MDKLSNFFHVIPRIPPDLLFLFFNVMILVGDGGEDDDAVDNGGDGDLSGEEGGGRKETGGDVSHGESVRLEFKITI